MLKINLILSLIYYFLMMVIGIFTYKYLWGNVSDDAIKYWMILFELSLILMLMDFGFTQKYIKDNLYGAEKEEYSNLGGLRLTLLCYGAIIVSILAFYCIVNKVYFYISLNNLILICLSFFINFLAYAETANLKVKNKFFKINVAQLGGAAFYILILIFFNKDYITNVSFAMLFRSIVLYVLQIENFYLKFNLILRPDFEAVKLNLSYFLFFSIDLIVLDFLNFSTLSLVVLGVYLKYFNIIRGIMDVLNNYVFLNLNNSLFVKFSQTSSVLIYIFFGIICDFLLTTYIGDFNKISSLSLILSLNFLMFNFYRVKSNFLYYKVSTYKFNKVFLGVILIKILFLSSFYFIGNLNFSYLIQLILIGILMYNIYFYDKGVKFNENK